MDSQTQIPSQSSPSSLSIGQQSSFSFILHKRFDYKTKYNLTSLIRDLEVGMRETCQKPEITVNYFSFTDEDKTLIKQPLSARCKSKMKHPSNQEERSDR